MGAFVALALLLTGFAVGGGVVFVALRRQYDGQIAALHRRLDGLTQDSEVAQRTAITASVEHPTARPASLPPVATASHDRTMPPERDTARLPAFREHTLRTPPISQSAEVTITPASSDDTPLGLVAPMIPAIEPLPPPTGPVSLPPSPLPIVPARPTAQSPLPSAPPPRRATRTSLPAPAQERRSLPPTTRTRTEAPRTAEKAETTVRVDPAKVSDKPYAGLPIAVPAPVITVTRRNLAQPEPEELLELEPLPDPRYASGVRPGVPSPAQKRRNDDEVTQLDPLEPELMAKLQDAPPPAPAPRAPSVTAAAPVVAVAPLSPSRVGHNGEVLLGREAHTNVLHVEESAWPDVGQAAGGWDIDNLLGDFARDVGRSEDDDKKG